MPDVLQTPQTPKEDEVTAPKRRGCRPDSIVRSLLAAGLTIDATWPIKIKLKNRMRDLNSAALETSLDERDLFANVRFCKLAQALFEALPREAEDWKLVAPGRPQGRFAFGADPA